MQLFSVKQTTIFLTSISPLVWRSVDIYGLLLLAI